MRAALKIGIHVTYSRYVTISEMGTSWTTSATSQSEKRVMNERTLAAPRAGDVRPREEARQYARGAVRGRGRAQFLMGN